MKTSCLPLLGLLVALVSPLSAEEVTLPQSALLKADRSIISLKAGTVVELVSRDGNKVTVRYQNHTGTIPAEKLQEPKVAEPSKPAAPAAKENTAAAKETPPADGPPARAPESTYGKAVQKAKDNAKAHDKNVVKPTDEIMK